MIVIIIIASFLAGGFLIIIISEKVISTILAKENEFYIRELQLTRKLTFPNYFAMVRLLKERKDNYRTELEKTKQQNSAEINELKKKILELSSYNKALRKKLELIEKKKAENHKDIPETYTENINKADQILYFSIPESDGRFKTKNSKPYNDGNCFYRIEPDKDHTTGNLYFISGSMDKRAIESIDFYLMPVCDIENISFRRNAFRIELITPGKVTLMNDSWMIIPDKRVKIKFI